MVRMAVICGALLLTACGTPDPETIVFAVSTAPGILDPRVASDAASERVNALLYDRLVVLDEQGTAQAGMASWQQISPTHYLITLLPERAGFWDGGLPIAADVVETYRSILDPTLGSPHSSVLALIESVVARNDAQIDFYLSRPDPGFPGRLTIGIAPAREQALGELARRPRGSGTFEFQGWRDDGGLLLKRRQDGQAVALVPVADPTMRALKLLRGEAQLLQNDLPSELYGYLEADPALRVLEHPGTTFAYIGFNMADPLLHNRDVRAAIAHAIDRDAIIRHLFGGRAQTAESVLRPEHWAGAEGLQPYAHDPELARRYLLRAGYDAETPLVLSYKTSTDPFRLRIAHVFQSQLARVGIELRISSYDWGTFFGDIKAGRFQMYSLAWVGVNTPDILRYAFHSESTPPGGANRGQYRSESVDELIRRAESADPAAASELYATIQQRVHQELVYVPLWYESNVVASRELEGYSPSHDGGYQALNEVRRSDVTR